jgi:hypothetical protein
MRRIKVEARAATIIFIVWSVTMAIGSAAAAEIITIPIDTVVYGKDGAVKVIDPPGAVSVPADKVGNQCSVHAIAKNNGSEHPNTDLIVTSGGTSVTVFDVEREGGGRTNGDGLLTLGEIVKIEVRFGADGVFSGGFVVGLCEREISCGDPALAIGVAPGDQEVAAGGDASFDVTVTNTGDEPFASVNVDSSVAACDHSSGGLLGVGERTSYTCTAEEVTADLDATFAAIGRGQDPTCAASANTAATVRVAQEVCNSDPALTITVVPEDQDVPDGGDAEFQVTVANTGDEDMVGVTVDSSVAACDNSIGALAVGGETSYACTANGVDTDLNVSFAVSGEGVTQGALCSASDEAAARVGNPPPPTTTTTTTKPPTTPTTKPPTTPTTAPAIPTGVPTGSGGGPASPGPIGALMVAALAVTAIGVGAYRVSRREQ